MFRWSILSVGTVFATLLSLHAPAYAFDKTTSSPITTDDPQAAVGWDTAVENSLIFSNPFADTSQVEPTPHTYFKAGIASNVTAPVNASSWQPGQYYHDSGTVGVAETGLHNIGRQEVGMGGWQYNANPDALTPPNQKPRQGVYVLAERNFYNTDHRTVVGFARAGHVDEADQRRNGWSAGFAMKGFVQDRPDGQFNFMVTGGRNPTMVENDPYDHTGGMHTRLELTYQDKITDNVTIQPGFNYTVVRGNDPAAVGGLVAGLRIHVSFK